MKKISTILCVSVVALTLAACGTKNEIDTGSNTSETTGYNEITEDDAPLIREDDKNESNVASETQNSENAEADAATILADPSTFNKANLSQEQLDALAKDAEENGYSYEWDENGTLVIIESDGDAISWGSKWEKNEFTEQVPALNEDFIVASEIEENGYAAMLSWTLEDAREYGEKIKNAGFVQDATSMDTESMFLYMASNDKYSVCISWGVGEGTNGALSISRK